MEMYLTNTMHLIKRCAYASHEYTIVLVCLVPRLFPERLRQKLAVVMATAVKLSSMALII